MKTEDKEEQVVLSITLLLITVSCLGFSFWSMTGGYESFVGSVYGSAALSFIIVLMLFSLNYRLRRGLMNGISGGAVLTILMLYLLVVLASFSGMFNKFYSTFMHTELIQEELTLKTEALRSLNERATTTLTNVEANKIRAQVIALVAELEAQIQNPSEPGLGPKAKAKLREIETLLRTSPITELKQPARLDSKSLADYAKQYHDLILNEGTGKMNSSQTISELNAPDKRLYAEKELPKAIKPVMDDLINKKEELSQADNPVAWANAIGSIENAVNVYKEVAHKVASLVQENKFDYDQNMQVENANIGKISHTYYSASKHMDHMSVWIAAFLALAIDLVVPMFVFFLTPRNAQASSRGSKGGAKPLSNDL